MQMIANTYIFINTSMKRADVMVIFYCGMNESIFTHFFCLYFLPLLLFSLRRTLDTALKQIVCFLG